MATEFPVFPIKNEDMAVGDLKSTVLTAQAQDKRLLIAEINLATANDSFVIPFDKAVTIITSETRVKTTAVNSVADSVVTLYNGGATNAISTITIADSAAEYEKDVGTTPDATHKQIAAGGYMNIEVTTAAGTSGLVTLVVVYHENE